MIKAVLCLFCLTAGILAEETNAKKLDADKWTITADIECGNSRLIERVGPSHFALAPREDPLPIEVQKTGPISNYIVYVEVTNRDSKPRELTLDIVIPAWLIRDKFDYFLRKTYLLRSTQDLEYYELAADRHERLDDRTRLRVAFAGKERKIVSTTPMYPYSEVRKRLAVLESRSNGRARVVEIGKSTEGRPILALETGDKSKPRAVFSATFQPGEPAPWGILSMAEAALFDAELTHYLAEYDLAFIPMTNPDGVVKGANNVNGKGEVVMLGFDADAQKAEGNVEAKVLWNYLKLKPPETMVEFHFMVLPNHPIPRPYVFTPELYSDPAKREAATGFVRRLERLSGAGEGAPIPVNHPMWKHLVTYNSIVNWNTRAVLYQNTGPKSSVRQAQRRAVEVMRVALEPGYMK